MPLYPVLVQDRPKQTRAYTKRRGWCCLVGRRLTHTFNQLRIALSFTVMVRAHMRCLIGKQHEVLWPIVVSSMIVMMDALFPFQENGLAELPSPADAASPCHTAHRDASDTTHTHSRSQQWWVHPYTGEARHLAEPVANGTMEVVEHLTAWVADLTVEHANHYISETGLINKNTRVYIEEAGNFPSPSPIMKLMATLRSGNGVPVGMRLTGNPGGPGHQWLRARYIDPAPMGWKVLTDGSGLERIYIPSRVTDNVYLGADYVQRLRASGSPELVRAWLEGDWSVVSGAFFPEFEMSRHVIAHEHCPITGLGSVRSTGAAPNPSPATGGPFRMDRCATSPAARWSTTANGTG